MSRWRDTKKGKDTSKDNTTLSIEEVDTINATLLSRVKAFVTDSFMIVMPLMYLSIY